MHKPRAKDGVSDLQLQIAFPEGEANHATGVAQENGPHASGAPSTTGSEPTRKSAGGPRGPGRRKWYSLWDKVFALPNLWRAWQRVRANQGAAGIDGMTLKRYAQGVEGRLEALCQDLKEKSYRPQPVRRVYIPKSGGGQRPLGIPTIRDRIVQQALLQVLEPIFEGKFSARSHGFRPQRGCATALKVVDQAVKHGYQWVVDADIQGFFDNVDHQLMLEALNEEIADGSVLDMVSRILKAGVAHPETSDVEPTELGTPQGGPLSPLLANIYLDRFDQRMVDAKLRLVRYADDFVIFAKSEAEATAALQLAQGVLEGELKLTLHPEKTRIVSVDAGFEFLGYHYYRDPKHNVQRKAVRAKSVKRFHDAIRERTPRLRNQRKPKARNITYQRLAKNAPLKEMIHALNQYLRGWHWYFKEVWHPYAKPFGGFDEFVRRRLRTAIVGRTGNGWWTARIRNRWLRALGLIPLDEWHERYVRGELVAPVRKD